MRHPYEQDILIVLLFFCHFPFLYRSKYLVTSLDPGYGRGYGGMYPGMGLSGGLLGE